MNQTLGEYIRDSRKEMNLTAQEVADRIMERYGWPIARSYLCEIEHGRRVPRENLLRALTDVLGISFDRAMALGNRLGEDTERYIKRHPDAVLLMRKIAAYDFSDAQIAALSKHADRCIREQRK